MGQHHSAARPHPRYSEASLYHSLVRDTYTAVSYLPAAPCETRQPRRVSASGPSGTKVTIGPRPAGRPPEGRTRQWRLPGSTSARTVAYRQMILDLHILLR